MNLQKLIFLLMISFQSFAQDVQRYAIIPKPVNLKPLDGFFYINHATKIILKPYNAQTVELGSLFSDYLSNAVQRRIEVVREGYAPEANNITIQVDPNLFLDPEGYQLAVTHMQLLIRAKTERGAFYGFQTLRQLLKPYSTAQVVGVVCPCGIIDDAPRFAHRGVLLDVSRHMFPVTFIKKFIDVLSFYKFNIFHWHLVDDQGWRIEIKRYPRLQEVAAYRDQTLVGHNKDKPEIYDNMRYGGYYTQQEIKEIIEYARIRQITIIPEIEMPGHCLASLAAYPELGCTKGPYKTATKWGIFEDIYCAGIEEPFEFLQNVLTEVIELFPSNYIHIGGDEVRKNAWKACSKCQARIKAEGLKNENELQSYFIKRMQKFLTSKNKHIIGWDEILEGGLAPNAIVMSWRGTQGGIEAAQANHNVIMTPHEYVYLDYYQAKRDTEPLAIGGNLPIEKVYNYEPVPHKLNAQQALHIIGAQANAWTEYIKTGEYLEYMAFPRALALAEVSWTLPQHKNYHDFIARLQQNAQHLKAMNVNYAKHVVN